MFLCVMDVFEILMKVEIKCDALRDLVPFAQFKKREKHPSRSVTFSKLCKASQICTTHLILVL